MQTKATKEGPTWTIDKQTDSSGRNEIPPNTLSFKNISNTNKAHKTITID